MTMSSRMPEPYAGGGGSNLADILERVLDKGVVIAGDIRINLLDIELLTIKLRLIVASVDKAKEMGIDWWEDDPELSSRARRKQLARENAELRERLAQLELYAEPVEEGRGEEEKKKEAP
ncbi:gas vesicle protein [Streptomyces sp. H51]|uniref:gas vesicle protein n=1 Tax=Streptomyces sp. H51 TaxID=3111770 RepID=UPI002D7A0296|nr:gas vesicle protein [Streptomyces sp. H51]